MHYNDILNKKLYKDLLFQPNYSVAFNWFF